MSNRDISLASKIKRASSLFFGFPFIFQNGRHCSKACALSLPRRAPHRGARPEKTRSSKLEQPVSHPYLILISVRSVFAKAGCLRRAQKAQKVPPYLAAPGLRIWIFYSPCRAKCEVPRACSVYCNFPSLPPQLSRSNLNFSAGFQLKKYSVFNFTKKCLF